MREKQRDKMVIYLDIDRVILGKNEDGKIALIPDFEVILSYLRKNYECCWLTTHGRYSADDVIKYLKPYLKGINPEELRFIKAVPWRTLKTESIDFDSLFIWIDDQPLQFELDILNKKGFLNRWLKVDTYTNYRELTIARIEAKRREILAAPLNNIFDARRRELSLDKAEIPVDEVKKTIESVLGALQMPPEKRAFRPSLIGLKLPLRYELVEQGIRTVASWGTDAELEYLRRLSQQGIAFVDKAIAEAIDEFKIYKLQDILVHYLTNPDPQVIESAISSLSSLEAAGIEELIIPFLRSAEEALPDEAAHCLGRIGSDRSLVPLFYSEIITGALNGRDIKKGFATSEQEAMWMILKKAFPRFFGDLVEEEDVTPEKLVRMKKLSPVFFLYFLKLAFQENPDITRKGLVLDKNIEVTLRFLRSLFDNKSQSELIDLQFLRRVAEPSEDRSILAKRILDVVLESGFPDVVKCLTALYIVFTPDYLNFGRSSNALNSLAITLKSVLARMSREDDFRRIFAALALLRLGAGREWEDKVLDFYRRDEWHAYPRLMRLGEKVLCDLPEGKKSIVYEVLLKSVRGDQGRDRIIEKLTQYFPKMAVELYERRLFELDPFEEALLYGKVGDRRGYKFILDNFIRVADARGIEYLGEFGGQDAIALLKEARDKHAAPEKFVNDALRNIERCLKKTSE